MKDQDVMSTANLLLRVQRLEAAEASRKRRLRTLGRTAGIAALATIVALPGLATALDPVPNSFTEGDVVSAAQMNENFAHLVAGITSVEAAVSGPDVPCGMTEPIEDDIGGYAGGALLCADACGNPDAHICTTHELIRHASAGNTLPVEGWVATGVLSMWPANPSVDDCVGFNGNGGESTVGVTWRDDAPGIRYCGGSLYPLHCCAPP
jgi:hypothetical protein